MTAELRVGVNYQGHTLSVPAGLFVHLLNCAGNRAAETQMQLENQPLNWESPLVNVEFANRKQSIQHCRDTVALVCKLRDYLKEHATCR